MITALMETMWYGSAKKFALLLLPLAWLYRSVMSIRRCLFRYGIKKIIRVNCPVIIVGNITVGGVGKTPFVIWLYHFLRSQGFNPGIISRGYGGRSKQWPQFVNTNSRVSEVGDEPVLLAQRCACPIWVGPNRVACAQQLLATSDCDIIISDDGLQHYALARDLEILILDEKRRLGNHFCLPAGPLREPVSRCAQVDWIINHGPHPSLGEYAMQLKPTALYSLADTTGQLPLSRLAGQTVHAVAGIGHPERFFATLRALGADVIAHAFADHHAFQLSDVDFAAQDFVVMTEKDAVKCQAFAKPNHYVLAVDACLDPEFEQEFLVTLKNLSPIALTS